MTGPGNISGVQGTPASPLAAPASVRADEVARFDKLAGQWWDPTGPMRPLHAMNPLRTGWIHRRIPERSLILDVGCGAGLAAEALARLGHSILGLDAAPDAIAAARAHAAGQRLRIDYRVGAAEDLVAESTRFPVITALEVIEHVTEPGRFLQLMAALLEPGGQLFISTLNRTTRSLMVAKVGAEYLLRLLPVGTHEWGRFVTPSELAGHARSAGLRLAASAGMTYSARQVRWTETRDLGINYIAMLSKPGNRALTRP